MIIMTIMLLIVKYMFRSQLDTNTIIYYSSNFKPESYDAQLSNSLHVKRPT